MPNKPIPKPKPNGGRQGSPASTGAGIPLPTHKLVAKKKAAVNPGTRKGSPGNSAFVNRDMKKAKAEANKYGSTR